jgi:hypothetical protein
LKFGHRQWLAREEHTKRRQKREGLRVLLIQSGIKVVSCSFFDLSWMVNNLALRIMFDDIARASVDVIAVGNMLHEQFVSKPSGQSYGVRGPRTCHVPTIIPLLVLL